MKTINQIFEELRALNTKMTEIKQAFDTRRISTGPYENPIERIEILEQIMALNSVLVPLSSLATEAGNQRNELQNQVKELDNQATILRNTMFSVPPEELLHSRNSILLASNDLKKSY